MEHFEFAGQRIGYDPEQARLAYAQIDLGHAERCGCRECRNYIAARPHTYPHEILALFTRLGIDPLREAEVYHANREPDGRHFYGGWFHFIGSVEKGPTEVEGPAPTEVGPLSYYFAEGALLPQPPFVGKPVARIEFSALVPWVLCEPPPE